MTIHSFMILPLPRSRFLCRRPPANHFAFSLDEDYHEASNQRIVSDEHVYGENQVVWLENARKTLVYMETDERFSAISFIDSWKNKGYP